MKSNDYKIEFIRDPNILSLQEILFINKDIDKLKNSFKIKNVTPYN